jgi:hypothetical protein
MHLANLDARTRAYMRREFDRDIAAGTLHISPRLSARGRSVYQNLLSEAIDSGSPDSFAAALQHPGRLNETEERDAPGGGMTSVRVPETAGIMLAEGEFNRFYVRGLCLRAIDEGIDRLVIYRAKAVEEPRPDSNRRIGRSVNPRTLLDDLRRNAGVDTALGIPPGPNSGLSVKLP